MGDKGERPLLQHLPLGLLLALFGIIALMAAPCAIANVTAGRVLAPGSG